MRGNADIGAIKNEAYVHNNTATEGWNAVVRIGGKGTFLDGPFNTKDEADAALIKLQDKHIGPGWRIVDGLYAKPASTVKLDARDGEF